jgi:asparagine synthase (glutamine-hydrolysing)
MELAKNHSTVVLNGQGVDEVLGGYDYFYGAYLLDLTKSFRIVRLIKEMYSLLTHGSLSKAIKYQFFYGLPVKLQSLFLAKKFPINKAFYENNKIHLHAVLKNLYHFKDLKDFFINHLEYKFEHHLLWADKSGMYFSLETRFPYIDHRIIEHSLATENDLVLNNGWSKYILREAMKNTVPEKIRMRYNKIGFETPEKEWFCLPEFQEFINELLNSTS